MSYKNPNYQKEYREINRAELNRKHREWEKNNKEKLKPKTDRKNKEYRMNNPEKIKEKKLIDRYGITQKEYDAMFHKQRGLCLICFNPETLLHNKSEKVRSLCVDHCHKTGKVRGLLCDRCNRGIANFKDSSQYCLNAAKYLKKNDN